MRHLNESRVVRSARCELNRKRTSGWLIHTQAGQNTRQQTLGVTGRHIDDQIPDPALGDRLQMKADGVDMNARHERLGLDHGPSLLDEFTQPSSGLLRLHMQAAEYRPVGGERRVARAARR